MIDAPPGDGATLHRHPYPEVLVLMDGHARVWVDGASADVHAGQIAIVPAEVFVLRDGQARFWVGDGVIDAHAGQIVVAPPDRPHRFVNSGHETLRTVNIQPVARMVVHWL